MRGPDKHREAKLLILDTEGCIATALPTRLGDHRLKVTTADSEEEAVRRISEEEPTLLIIHVAAEESAVLKSFRRLRRLCPSAMGLAVLSDDSPGAYEAACKAGAFDCLSLPLLPQRFESAVLRTLEHQSLRAELRRWREMEANSFAFDNLIGISQPMLQLRETARKLAPTDITVLLQGAPGTGKKLLARAIHHHSKRRRGPFVTVDFSAIPETVMPALLLGGGGSENVVDSGLDSCLAAQADGGTLFLDDVAAIPVSLQPHMARFLLDQMLGPCGAADSRKLDVRVIATTTTSLRALAEDGRIDPALAQRLEVIPLELPTLCERSEDIEILVSYFLRRLSHELGGPLVSISRRAVEKLQAYDWPGNVRELENSVRRAAALCSDNRIKADDVSFIGGDGSAGWEGPGHRSVTLRRNGRLDDSQREIIVKALDQNDWNFTQTARELGIGRTTLWRKIKKYQLSKEDTTAKP